MLGFDLPEMPIHVQMVQEAAVVTQAVKPIARTFRLVTGISWDLADPAVVREPSSICKLLKYNGFFGKPGGNSIDTGDFKCTILGTEKQPAHGTVKLRADGRLRYEPNKGFIGKDKYTYFVEAEGRRARIEEIIEVTEKEPIEEEGDPDEAIALHTSFQVALMTFVSP